MKTLCLYVVNYKTGLKKGYQMAVEIYPPGTTLAPRG